MTSSGVTITFNSVKDEEYEINIANKTGNVLITGSEFYPESEVLFISDTDSKADNDAKIKASTSKKMISLDRTLSSQYWNTFCLPMTINKLTISSQLKCDGTYILKSYDKSKNIIEFEKLEFVRANVPCLIKPTEDIVNPVLTGSNNIAFNETTLTATSNGLSFVGIYGYDDLGTDKTKFYLNTSGKLVYPTSSENNASKLRGFRAYFMLDEASAKNMTFIFDDSETTGISTIEHDVKIDDQKIYTIDGRFVGSSTEGLKKGIYISNGHKFVVNK
ncbi:MAG: hypothetical protein IJV27_01655 [Prevotella sp.]|nr:hypothetical protein [Prevotella sp.]